MSYRRKSSIPDRRGFPRYEVRNAGRLLFMDQPCLVECTIRNISADGALLSLATAVGLPNVVLLWERRTGAIHECEVRWCDGNVVGVHFTDVNRLPERHAVLEAPLAALKHAPRHRSSMH